jgi:hypothetical protein
VGLRGRDGLSRGGQVRRGGQQLLLVVAGRLAVEGILPPVAAVLQLLYPQGQGEADRLCARRGRVALTDLQECHNNQLGGHFGRHKSAGLVSLLAYWQG